MVHRNWVRIIAGIFGLSGCVVSGAFAEDPPAFAFEWVVPYTPQQLSIDPSGNLWILDDAFDLHRTTRDGHPLYSTSYGKDVACASNGNAYLLQENGFELIQPDGIVICRVTHFGIPNSIAAVAGDEAVLSLSPYTGALVRFLSNCEPKPNSELMVPYVPGDMAGHGDVLFVADPSNHRVVIHDDEGMHAWPVEIDNFDSSTLATDSDGNVFICTATGIHKYSSTGALLYEFGGPGHGPGEFDGAAGIAVNATGDIYVSDANNHRLQMFGTRLAGDDPPPPPPPPIVSNKPPLTPHANVVLLHVGELTRPACFGPPSLSGAVTAVDLSDETRRHDFVYLIASPDSSRMGPLVCGVQVGIAYDSSVEVLSWHSCSDLEFSGDTWPASGSGNTMTWTDNEETDVVVAGYFEVIAHGPSRMRVIPWPVTGMAKIANCQASEYVLEVPPDRLGWVSWGHAGFGPDTDGCNPTLEPCQPGAVPARSSTWGRLKSLYGH